MIKIYPSKLEGEPVETHTITRVTTIAGWLADNVRGYKALDEPPISISVNGAVIPANQWTETEIEPSSDVKICVEPKGIETVVAAVVAIVAVAAAILLAPKVATSPVATNQPQRGRELDLARVKGNTPRLNAPIREIAGRMRVYPDYLLPARRYFRNRTEQWVECLLAVGAGEYQLPLSRIRIGETTATALGAGVEIGIYGPGVEVSDPAAQWWHQVTEVGVASTGAAGLLLEFVTSATPAADFTAITLDGYNLIIPDGAGQFPDDWVSGMIIRVVALYPYTVASGTGVDGRDVISGDIAQLAVNPGDIVEIVGVNEGTYTVHSATSGALQLNFASGAPAVGLQSGSVPMGIGPIGMNYRIVSKLSSQLEIERLLPTGGVDVAWPGFSALTTSAATVELDETTAELGWSGPFAACPPDEVTSTLEIDVFFPQGLFKLDTNNVRQNRTVTVEFQYRAADSADPWVSVFKTYTAKTPNQIGFTERFELETPFRPECRMRRTSRDSNSATTADDVQWYGLRSRLNAPVRYEGVTVMALRMRGGNKVATQSEQLVSVEPTRILPIRRNGGEAGTAPTRDIAPWIRYIAASVGYGDESINLQELDALDDLWRSRGETFDAAYDDFTTVRDALAEALRAGFSELTIDRGQIRPVRDSLRVAFDHMYTPQNMTVEPLKRQFSSRTGDDFDGVDVQFTDSRTWQNETVSCRLPGDLGERVETLKIVGVTNRTQAWRIGMRRRRQQVYQRDQFSFGTELDALNSRYLSYVALADDVPGYGLSALVVEWQPLGAEILVKSSEPLPWTEGEQHVIALRRKDGTLSGPYPAKPAGDYGAIIPEPDFTLDTSFDLEPPHLLFGTQSRWSYPALITQIDPANDGTVSVLAVNYDPRIYDDDDNSPPSGA